MKGFNKIGQYTQKIIASILILVLCIFLVPKPVYAEENGFLGKLGKPIVEFGAGIFDIAIGILNHFMLGTTNFVDSVMLDKEDPNVDSGSLKVDLTEKAAVVNAKEESLVGFMYSDWKLPNMLFSVDNIFSNNIAMLDINFINPFEFKSVETGDVQIISSSSTTITNSGADGADAKAVSIASNLQSLVSKWFINFRNIAIVGLLSVLIYIGIRILIGSTAQDKAKYKERLVDWLVALCLVFAMQFIMSGTIMLTTKLTELLNNSGTTAVVVQVPETIGQGSATSFRTNLMGYMRFMVQVENFADSAGYAIIYMVLVFYTCRFTFVYLKRVLYMAFFTIISPLVALTYPLDKISDGKAQAFNMWIKEYIMNALIQPIHLILYTFLVSSSMELAVQNPIYAIVAIGFLIPAEKFIKEMFGFNKAKTPGALGDVVRGAITAKGVADMLPKGKRSNSSNSSKQIESKENKVRYQGENNIKNMNAWKDGENSNIPMSEGQDEDRGPGIQDGKLDGNPIQNTDNGMELDEYGNPIQNTDNGMKLDEYGNPIQNTDNGMKFDEYGNPIQNINNGKNVDEKGNPIQETGVKSHKYKGDANLTKKTSKARKNNKQKGKRSTLRKFGGATGALVAAGGRALGGALWRNKRKIVGAVGSAVGAGVGTMVGFASGVASGDMSKAITGAGAGLATGRSIGSGTANLAGNIFDGAFNTVTKKIPNAADNIRNVAEEGWYGLGEARERRVKRENEKQRAAFKKDAQQRKRFKEMTAQLNQKGVNVNLDEVMDRAFDYQSSHVEDDKAIRTGILMEHKHGLTSEQAINVMQESAKYNDDYFIRDEKYDSLVNSMNARLGKEKGQQVVDLIAESKQLELDNKRQKARRKEEEIKARREKYERKEDERGDKEKKTKDKVKRRRQKRRR